MSELSPSARLGLARYRVRSSKPEGFTDDMVSLLAEKLRIAEDSMAVIEESCRILPCGGVYEKLAGIAEKLAQLAESGDPGVFDVLDEYLKRLGGAALLAITRLRTAWVASASSGVVVALASIAFLTLPVTDIQFLMGLTALFLGLAAAILSKYRLGPLLAVAGAVALSASTSVLPLVILAVAAAGLAGAGLSTRRTAREVEAVLERGSPAG